MMFYRTSGEIWFILIAKQIENPSDEIKYGLNIEYENNKKKVLDDYVDYVLTNYNINSIQYKCTLCST
jgi:hypothetical protein